MKLLGKHHPAGGHGRHCQPIAWLVAAWLCGVGVATPLGAQPAAPVLHPAGSAWETIARPGLFPIAGDGLPLVAGQAEQQDTPASLEEKLLLPLQLKEQELLQRFGSDYPEVRAVRGRMAVVREFLARQPPPAARPEPVQPAARPAEPAPVTAGVVVEKPPTVLAAPAVATPTPARAVEQPASTLQPLMVQLVSILAAVVVILLIQLVALIVILRRWAAKLSPLLRLEVVNGPGWKSEPVAGEVLAQRIYLDSPEHPARRSRVDDIPDYHDEWQAEATPDAAVLRQVFEDNLRLRQQLGAVEAPQPV